MDTKVELKNGYFKTNICLQNKLIDSAFKKFMSQNFSYRKQFTQRNYDYAFDGYSFLGQEDSTNQYAKDLLHSFVISEFHSINKFPVEFQYFLKNYWIELTTKLKKVEIEILKTIKIDNKKDILDFHNKYIGHMMSMNYYPSYINYKKNEKRLSIHKDVSLLTVFPFGVSKGLTLINETGLETDIDATDKLIAFPGYLLECLTNGKIKGLNHFLKFNGIHNEKRFSYASFSIPRPCKSLPILNLSTKEYFDRYLSLF